MTSAKAKRGVADGGGGGPHKIASQKAMGTHDEDQSSSDIIPDGGRESVDDLSLRC